MAKDGTFFDRLLIALFAAGVVALGAHEIHLRYGGAKVSRGSKQAVIQDLHGENQVERGRFSFSEKFFSKKKYQDDLDRSDRKNLQNLIDSVAE